MEKWGCYERMYGEECKQAQKNGNVLNGKKQVQIWVTVRNDGRLNFDNIWDLNW